MPPGSKDELFVGFSIHFAEHQNFRQALAELQAKAGEHTFGYTIRIFPDFRVTI